jgi:AcrR family transcriptional regulator
MKKDVAVRRTEILEATCRVVVERGFGGARIADIADRLGVSTGLIHYHFDAKDQLLAEAFAYAAQEDLARLRSDIDAGSTLADKLDAAFAMFGPETGHPSWGLWIDAWGEALRTPALAEISRSLDVEWKDELERVIRDGVTAGECTCDDPRAAAWRLAALLDGLAVQVTVHAGVLTERELTEWVRAAAIRELGLSDDAFAGRRRKRPAGSGSRAVA